jgi:hypothetical protein
LRAKLVVLLLAIAALAPVAHAQLGGGASPPEAGS